MSYVLRITFNSNEHPWSSDHEPILDFATDEDAQTWAFDMAHDLDGYTCTLLKDGQVLDITERAKPGVWYEKARA